MSSEDNIIININGGQQSYPQQASYPQPAIYAPIDQQVHYQQSNMPVSAVAVQSNLVDRVDSCYWVFAILFGLTAFFYSQSPAQNSVAQSFYVPPAEQSESPSTETPRQNSAPRADRPPIQNSVPSASSAPRRNLAPVQRPSPVPQPKYQTPKVERSAPMTATPASSKVDSKSEVDSKWTNVDSKWTNKKSSAFVNKTVTIAQDLQINPNDLFAIMDFESAGIDHRNVNPLSGATGLIQFMPSTARGLGTSTQALKSMSEIEQLDYVKKYFQPYKGRIKDLPDVYCAVLWPKCVGKSSDYVLFTRGNITYTQNNGFDKNKDGIITKQEITTLVKGRL